MLKTASNFAKLLLIFSIIILCIFPLLFFSPSLLVIKQSLLNQIIFIITPIALIVNIAIYIYLIVKKKYVNIVSLFLTISVLELIIIGYYFIMGAVAAASFIEGVSKILN
jgi:hypothetical protein